MVITDYIAPNEYMVKLAKASIMNDYVIASGDEYFYFLVGKNSFYPFYELLHEDDRDDFFHCVSHLSEGTQEFTGRFKNCDGIYRMFLFRMYYNGKILDNGFESFDIELFDIDNMATAYIRQIFHLRKYRSMLSSANLLYFEYEYDTNIFMVYSYNDEKSINLYTKSLDEWYQESMLKASDEHMKANLALFYDSVSTGLNTYEIILSRDMFDNTNDKTEVKIAGRLLLNNSKRYMSTGVIFDYMHSKDEGRAYYLSEAAKDVMTGLLNKRAISEYIKDTLREGKESFYFIMMDIDYFKQINDTYGHQFGDNVIVQVANIIKESISSRGECGRFGGDEFMMIIRSMNSEEELRLILKTIAKKLRWLYRGNDINIEITASMGVVKYPDDGTKYEDLFAKADRSLYIAKEKGRNRFIIYDEKKHGIQSGVTIQDKMLTSQYTHMEKAFLVSEMVHSLYTSPIDNKIITDILEQVRNIFSIDGITIYMGEKLQQYACVGIYENSIEEYNHLKNNTYLSRFNQYNLYVENNIHNIESVDKYAYGLLHTHHIDELLQYYETKEDVPYYLISYDILNRSIKWSDCDIHYLSIISKAIVSRLRLL